ncbi:hypothetical protein D1869_04895 [Sulfurisphaera ohwakuensis]|uniref:Uncharacterized protein n=1 Tax=Sulfurisphaera ohwakuensis TaxID=69656 RepID=A0A650CFG5_SULOH|nr:hypothetical protein [Sulfurisphaera ohwakuensis]QGR16603.1 hypothetical protein D1869_04895 [Sulfurisphaera ohwakuensis]
MITTVVRSEETEIDIKKAIKTSLLMTFFLVAIPINSIMLTQAILAYGFNSPLYTVFTSGSPSYFLCTALPIFLDWGSVLLSNGASISEVLYGILIGTAMSDPVVLAVLGVLLTA